MVYKERIISIFPLQSLLLVFKQDYSSSNQVSVTYDFEAVQKDDLL